ncbi:MAG: LysR family transcriptional regulator [Proteobacteria bacterium]|nr:LysR family transcriptional regulator [Pseudomonadota bacterium]
MQVLQTDVGLDLYKVYGKTLVLTPDGVKFAERANAFLIAEATLLARPTDPGTGLRIATHETLATHLITPFWTKHFQDLPLVLREIPPGRLEESVALGLVDVGLTQSLIPREGVDFVLIKSTEMGLYGHEKFRDTAFQNSGFLNLPFVVPVTPLDTTPTSARGLDNWPDLEFPRLSRYRVDSLASAMQIVQQGAAVIFLPTYVAKNSMLSFQKSQLMKLKTPKSFPKITRDIHLVQKLGTPETKHVRQLAAMIRVVTQ